MFFIRLLVCITVIILSVNNAFKTSYGRLHVSRILLSSSHIRRNSFYSRNNINDLKGCNLSKLNFKVSESDEGDGDEVEEDIQFSEAFSGSSKIGFLKKISKAVVPVAASLGFAVAPSSNVALRVAGAAVGGTAGFFAKRLIVDKIISESEDGDNGNNDDDNNGDRNGGNTMLPKSVANALEAITGGPPIMALNLARIEQIAKKHRVSNDDLGLFFTHLFAEVIVYAVEKDEEDITELSEVIDFADSLSLSEAEIGDGFSLAAIKIGNQLDRDDRGFFDKDFPDVVLYQAAKLFFLGDKMIGKTTGFYGKRLSVALSYFTADSLKEIISDACTVLFKKCVESVLSSPDNFTVEEVDGLRKFLTTSASVSSLRPSNMQNMIMEAFQLIVDNSLKKSTSESHIDAVIPDYDSMKKAQVLLGWNSIEFVATLETKTLPVFEKNAREIISQLIQAPERSSELADMLKDRMHALNIDKSKARVLLTTLISEQNNLYMNKIDKVYGAAKSIEPAYKTMLAFSATHDGLKVLVKDLMDGVNIPVPGLPFADMVKVSLYEMQLSRKDTTISSDMFDLNEEQRKIVKKTLSLPKVCSWVSQCISESNFATDAKNAYQKLLTQFEVTEKEWEATSVDFYYQEVQKIGNSRAIPSLADMDRLATVAAFLQCSQSSVSKVHLELLGDKYVKAVKESMTPTGTISEEYIDGLDRLRNRLCLSVEDTQSLFGLSIRERISPIIKDLTEIWRSDTDGTRRRELERKGKKDKSGDPISDPDSVFGFMEVGSQKEGGGPNTFMREATNLVDFYIDNYEPQGIDVYTLDALPVSATGVIPDADVVGLYKHYLITRLAEQDNDLRARYERNEKVFALSLGISQEGQAKVRESLLYTADKNMLKRVFQYKDAVDTQDLQQLAALKDRLGLDQATSDKVLDEASRGAILEHAATFMRPKAGQVTPKMAETFRSQIQSLGYDMKTLGFNGRLLTYLYALEVQSLVENGMESDLKEVQEAYDIPEDVASEIIQLCCKKYVSQLFNLALRAAKKFNEKETIQWVREILKYASFISDSVDADGNLFSQVDKDRMIEFTVAEMGQEERAAITEKLNVLCSLKDDFSPPIEGIDGLLDMTSERKHSNLI